MVASERGGKLVERFFQNRAWLNLGNEKLFAVLQYRLTNKLYDVSNQGSIRFEFCAEGSAFSFPFMITMILRVKV